MAESLRDLVVSLSLNTENFTRNIKSVNKQIQEAESYFKLAAAGVEGFENTTEGLTTKLSTLERRLSMQKDVVTQYERALAQALSEFPLSDDIKKFILIHIFLPPFGLNGLFFQKDKGRISAFMIIRPSP